MDGGAAVDNRREAFGWLMARAQGCRLCPRMEGRRRVLGAGNGPIDATVLFVAEAPGRLGGERTGVPLAGDRSGDAFEGLLAAAGLVRDAVFVTNAVLCNPRDGAGRNARPSAGEVRACRTLLGATIEVVDPAVVVALGTVALAALGAIAPHGVGLAAGVGTPVAWGGRWLVPLYHPGARAQIRRPLAAQREDYRRLGCFVRAVGGMGFPKGTGPDSP